MTFDDSPFDFSARWYEVGVVTPARLAKLRAEWERGEDRNPEHYRWRAFKGFLTEQRPLGAALAAALYELGERDPDRAMGQSMMHTIVELPECPPALLEAARVSGQVSLARAAERRRASFDAMFVELMRVLRHEPATEATGALEPVLVPFVARRDTLAFLRTVPAGTSRGELERLAAEYCAAHPPPPADDADNP